MLEDGRTTQNRFDPLHRLITLILLVTGCPFIAIGLYEAIQTRQEISTYQTTAGTIVDNTYQSTSENGGAYYPIIEFKPLDGPTTRFTDGIGSLPPDYEVGETIEILYNPQDVRQARINSWKRLWFAPTLLIAIGLLPITFFLAWVLVSKTSTQR